MLHRYFAMGVGFLIIVITVWAWVKRQQFGARIASLASLILLLVCVQGAFGAWTVTLKLQPIIVTTHLMLGLSLLATQTYLSSLSSKLEHGTYGHQKVSSYRMNRGSIWFALIVLIVQIFLGGWVSTNYAVLAYVVSFQRAYLNCMRLGTKRIDCQYVQEYNFPVSSRENFSLTHIKATAVYQEVVS